MILLSLCETPEVLSVFQIIKIIITIIKIIVPIGLIISLMIEYLNAVKSKDYDAIAKANKNAISKAIAAILVFLVPTFVDVIANVASYDSNEYAECITNANDEYISGLIEDNARVYLGFAKDSLKRTDYLLASSKINKIVDASVKNSLLSELAELDKEITEKEKKEAEEKKQKNQTGGNSGSNSGSGSASINIAAGVSGSVENVMGVYYYDQCDPRWETIQYDTNGGNMCSSSCGYTSLAMIAAGLNNDTSINPYTVVKAARGIKDGEKTSYGYGAASWTELTDSSYISRYNLSAKNIVRSDIMTELKNGHPVIALVPGHYVVLSYSKNGKVVLLDPYTNWADHAKKSGEWNSISDIESHYGGIQNAYSYTKK